MTNPKCEKCGGIRGEVHWEYTRKVFRCTACFHRTEAKKGWKQGFYIPARLDTSRPKVSNE